MVNSQARLPFWAPTSKQGRDQKIHNKKINERLNPPDFRAPGQKEIVWGSEDFAQELTGVMMTYDDARQCTFQPSAGSNISEY